MKILIIVAEIAPFTYVGGLARGTYALAKALTKKGHDVRIMTPMHWSVGNYFFRSGITPKNEKKIQNVNKGRSGMIQDHVSIVSFERSKVNEYMYFVNLRDYFGLRSQVYGYIDDYKRYYLFSRTCLEWLLSLQVEKDRWAPDIIQCHDWHTGYFIDLLKNSNRYRNIKNIPVVFTVHNFKYQNETKFQYMDEEKVDMGEDPLADIDSLRLQEQNALSRGMLFADNVNTVSPTHAKEITLSDYEYSYNLHKVICKIQPKLSGILNGLDYKEFNPLYNMQVQYKYSEKNADSGRFKNKQYLRQLFSLPNNGDSPLFCYVGRMTSQKGLEILFEAMGWILKKSPKIQLIGVGDGEDHYCELFWRFKKEFPNQVGIKLVHDIDLPKQIFAGADTTLVPSNFEPGGIVVLEALRYGSIPLIRRTGGLNDIITDFSTSCLTGNGFSFKERDSRVFYRKIMDVLEVYQNKHLWSIVIKNCMAFRRTWADAAIEYERLFEKVVNTSHKNI